MSTVQTATVKSRAAATPPIFRDSANREIGQLIGAWVNFNGTGTIAIRNSFNVTSLTDHGTGDYTVTFTNAFANANYSVGGCCQHSGVGSPYPHGKIGVPPATGSFRMGSTNGANSVFDCEVIMMMFLGDTV